MQIQSDLDNLQQVILSAQNAIRSLSPAMKRYDSIAYFTPSDSPMIGNQLISVVSGLESLVRNTKIVQDQMEQFKSEVDQLEEFGFIEIGDVL